MHIGCPVSKKFYVYAHYKLDDGTVFYIGKGSTNRAYSTSHRSRWWKSTVKVHGYTVSIWSDDLDEATAFKLESEWINLYGRRDTGAGCLVNMTDGGDGASGKVHSQETKDKIRNSNLGKIVSLETRLKLSKSKKGKPNIACKGIPRSPEVKAKVAAALKGRVGVTLGRKASEETKKKLSDLAKQRKYSPATRAKISIALKGRIFSEESKAKISEAKTLYWKNKRESERVDSSVEEDVL